MADEVKPDTTPADGGGAPQDETPAPARKKFEFDADAQEFINGKIDEAYQRAFKKAEAQLGGQLAEAQTKMEQLTKELGALRDGSKGKEKGKESDGQPQGGQTKAEIEDEAKKLRAQISELQEGLKTIKSERDTMKTTLESTERERRESTKLDKFLSSIPDRLKFFSPKEAYALAMAEGQLQLNDKGDLVVINPATGLPRLGRDMEPMKPEDYIAEFASKRPWMVEADVAPGTGGTESRTISVRKGQKSYADMTPVELEAEIQRVKNQARG